jgi:hypothetical protein
MNCLNRCCLFLFCAALIATGCAGGVSSSGTSDKNPEDSAGSGGESSEPAPSGSGGSSGGGNFGSSFGGHGQGGQSSNRGGSSASGGQGGSIGTPQGGNRCRLKIGGLSVTSLSRVVAGPAATVTVQARLDAGIMTPPSDYDWVVTFANQEILSQTSATGEFTFPVANPGTYIVHLSTASEGFECDLSTSVLAVDRSARATDLWMRVIPPQNSDLVPDERWLSVTPATAAPTPAIQLNPATKVNISPQRSSPAGMLLEPSFVRLTSRDSTFRWENHTQNSNGIVQGYTAQLNPLYSYDVLVVPDRGFAPFMKKGVSALMLNTTPIEVTTGSSVRGKITFGNERQAAARILLRNGPTPSTLGTADANGSFSLLSSQGTFGAYIRPSDQSNLPDLTLSETDGIEIPNEGAITDLTVNWKAMPLANLSLQVVSLSNGNGIGDVEVQIDSALQIPNAGTLQVASERVRNLSGSVLRRKRTAPNGEATISNLPRGSYKISLIPPKATGLARTTATINVDQANLTAVIKVAAKVKISGSFSPVGSAAGSIMQAYDSDSPTDPPVLATVGKDGNYNLAVDPYRTYRLRVVPDTASGSPVSPLATVGVLGADMVMPTRTMPTAIRIKGSITGAGSIVAGSIVQIFCIGSDKDCVCRQQSTDAAVCPADANVVTAVPLAEVLADATGHFSLLAVDPASL